MINHDERGHSCRRIYVFQMLKAMRINQYCEGMGRVQGRLFFQWRQVEQNVRKESASQAASRTTVEDEQWELVGL